MCALTISYTQTKYDLAKHQVLANQKWQFLPRLKTCLCGGEESQVCEVTHIGVVTHLSIISHFNLITFT